MSKVAKITGGGVAAHAKLVLVEADLRIRQLSQFGDETRATR
jgi:hypothetical protein